MTNKTALKLKTITIIGRRWFQRTYGNTYHTAQIAINGVPIHKTAEEYGYGDQYKETAFSWLEKNGYLKRKEYANGSSEAPWQWANRNKVLLVAEGVDVARERDL